METLGETEGLSIVRRGATAVVTFDRPAVRNAVTVAMRRCLMQGWKRIAREPTVYAVVERSAIPGVFSVGGDLRELMALAAADRAAVHAAVGDVSMASWLLECFSKPTLSLYDGHVIGTGAGLSIYGTHRVAGARFRFAMPECSIGYFVDCGLAYAFARMPHAIGPYLALTGRGIGRADALWLGLVTHCIDAEHYDAIQASLADAEPIDPLLDARHVDPGQGELVQTGLRIERYFAAADVAEILARLEAAPADDRAWADAVLADMRRASPLSLCVSHRAIRKAASLDLRGALLNDARIACRIIVGHDIAEGVRARLVAKSHDPVWQPERVADVTDELVESHFEPHPAEVALPARAEMQAARA